MGGLRNRRPLVRSARAGDQAVRVSHTGREQISDSFMVCTQGNTQEMAAGAGRVCRLSLSRGCHC